MRTRITAPGVFFLTFLTLAWLSFLAPDGRAATPMEQAWERLEKAFHKLRDGLKEPQDSDKETYVKLGQIIKTEARACLELDPKMLKNVPAAEQEAFLQGFRKDMETFVGNVEQLNVALENGQWAEAQKLVSVLGQAKKAGHKAYREKEKR